MKLLFVTGSYPPIKCGVSEGIYILAHHLARHDDMHIGILTSSFAETDTELAAIEVLPLIDTWSFAFLGKVMRAIRAWNPDIIHIDFPTAGYGRCKMPVFLPAIFKIMGFPCVQRWHEPITGLRCLRYLPAALASDSLVVVEPDYGRFVPAWFWQILRTRKRHLRHIPVGSNMPEAVLNEEDRQLIRSQYGAHGKRLLAYFGFVIPSKGLELLFDVASPDTDRLLLICELDEKNDYQKRILELTRSTRWENKVVVTGYLGANEVSRLLAVADAVVFPFVTGVTHRNASVLAARTQRTFVLTTSFKQNGYSAQDHVYYATPGNIQEIRQALFDHAGMEPPSDVSLPADWNFISEEHIKLYGDVLKGRTASSTNM